MQYRFACSIIRHRGRICRKCSIVPTKNSGLARIMNKLKRRERPNRPKKPARGSIASLAGASIMKRVIKGYQGVSGGIKGTMKPPPEADSPSAEERPEKPKRCKEQKPKEQIVAMGGIKGRLGALMLRKTCKQIFRYLGILNQVQDRFRIFRYLNFQL